MIARARLLLPVLLSLSFLLPRVAAAEPDGNVTVGTTEGVDAGALADALVEALARTTAEADGEILSEIQNGGYRIGLVLGPARVVRARAPGGRFITGSAPDPEQTFVGVVLREPRTKRFLPAARVTAILEFEGGGDVELPELVGAYPMYGANLQIPKDELRGVTIKVGPPAYNRHAEMLAAFTGEGVARFEVRAQAPSKNAFALAVKDPQPPAPVAEDWTLGDDLRQAVGEARGIARAGEFLVGFIAEGPEPIWLWQGEGNAPEHCAIREADTNHLETIVIHEPTGLMVTGANVVQRFTGISEKTEFALRPLLAEFYHYGLTAPVPPGDWTVEVLVDPPRGVAAWGRGALASPERRLLASFSFTREVEGGGSISDEARGFADRLALAAKTYGEGRKEEGLAEATDAFFAFEGSRLDARLRVSDPSAYGAVESEWIALRARMEKGARPTEVGLAARSIGDRLVTLAASLEAAPAGGASRFVQSLVILLREGFEAILVIGLLVAVLRRTRREDAVRQVYGGAIAALVASAALGGAAVLLLRNMESFGAVREGFEGVVILLSVVVLFFASYWLISRVEGRRWANFVKHQLEEAVSGKRRYAIVALAFLVVFREGAETVLMYAALFASSPGGIGAILAGMGVAVAALVALFWAFVIAGRNLPVRPFFAVSGVLLYVLAFKFAGDGIMELQAAGWVPATAVEAVPASAALQAWLGIRPTVESLAAQGILLVAVLLGLAWTFLRRPAAPAPASDVAAG